MELKIIKIPHYNNLYTLANLDLVIIKDIIALKEPYDLSFNKFFQTNTAILL